MSKQPSNTTKQRLLRRGLAGILSLALILGLLPGTLFTSADAASWATPYVNTLVDWGVMRGDIGGNMAPDRSITRAEFVTMMNRAYGYTKLGGHPFTDVRVRDWYNEDIDIAYNIGYFKGTGPTTASPNDTLTREQAAVLLARNMMLQETVGETLGFSDSRTLSDWSRGLVGAAASHGIISGYEDGSFKPFNNITRGEVAAMLVRAIGTPIQTAGDHALGNVYGNVTVNTSGVKLRDGVIVGNLYLTGGIDLGDVLLENITVLGEIVVSGGGESNSSQSSIIMRNVTADGMVVDSIGSQFVTIRAEGDTDIPTTTVRTNAFVDDSSLPGYGLSHIVLDGEDGALYQLAGNIKEVVNKTPGSDMQFVQGTANKVTVDEEAKDSSVLVDGDAVVDELDLDTATTVTGTGDIGQLNVGAAGSTVEQLPDKIEIRPGITTDINGSEMNSSQAAESSSGPKLLAGYPAVRKIAPTNAELVFQTNKTGTIYWAVSAVADGSVSEADLLEPPVYGNKIVASGNVAATAANKEFTAAVTGLTTGGSYYVTAMLVDGRKQNSPIKVTSFTTPDSTVPAFAQGYPVMSKVTCDEAQVTVMTTKSCLLYYALLPKGATAPTPNEFKAAAIPGNLGYGSQSVTKSVTIQIQVNDEQLEEKTDYVLYLWLTDHDGAQSARSVTALPFTTPDETPPVVTSMEQVGETPTSIRLDYAIDEPADLVWAIVTEGDHTAKRLFPWTDETFEPNNEDKSTLKFENEAALLAAKVRLVAGTGAVASGTSNRSPLNITNLPTTTSSYVLYYIADDNATASGNLSAQIKAIRVHTEDNIKPSAKLSFTNKDETVVTEDPDADADISIIFSEGVKGGTAKGKNVFLNLYRDVVRAQEELNRSDDPNSTTSDEWNRYNGLKETLGSTLAQYITLYRGTSPTGTKVNVRDAKNQYTDGTWVIDWRNAKVEAVEDGSGNVRVVLPTVTDADGNATTDSALNLDGGTDYYFHLTGITDLAITNNPLEPYPDPCYLPFSTSYAKIKVNETENWEISIPGQDADRKRYISFSAEPVGHEKVGEDAYWDMLIWSNTSMNFSLYTRPLNDSTAAWTPLGGATGITVTPGDGYTYAGLYQKIVPVATGQTPGYERLNSFRTQGQEYLIYINSLDGNINASTWNYPDLQVRVSFVAGTRGKLSTPNLASGTQTNYNAALADGVSRIEEPTPCYIKKPIQLTSAPGIKTASVQVSDTSATINVTLDKDGYVYYLLLPMDVMRRADNTTINNTTTPLTETVVQSISDFDMYYRPEAKAAPKVLLLPKSTTNSGVPAMMGSSGVTTYEPGVTVGTPNLTQVTNGAVSSTYPQGCMPAADQSAAPGGSQIRIPLTDELDPNTVYYVFLVTRSATAIYSDDPVCFRITTQEPQRPTIDVKANGLTGVGVTVDRTTNLTYFLARNGNEGTLTSLFAEGYANSKWWKTGAGTDDGWVTVPTGNKGTFTYKKDGETYTFTYNRNTLDKMTVIDAMATPCYSGTLNLDSAYKGSVFDIFADPNIKPNMASTISGGNIDGVIPTTLGTRECGSVDSTVINFTGLSTGFYTFVSVGTAARGQGSGPAFRAYYSIRVESYKHPTVVGKWQNTTTTSTSLTNVTVSGGVSITFNEALYFISKEDISRRDAYVVDNCGSHGSSTPTLKDDAWALGDILEVNSTGGTATLVGSGTHSDGSVTRAPQTIQVNFSGLREGDEIYYQFTQGLTNADKVGYEDQLRVVFRIVATLIDPDATTPTTRYRYSAELVSITKEWNGGVLEE